MGNIDMSYVVRCIAKNKVNQDKKFQNTDGRNQKSSNISHLFI